MFKDLTVEVIGFESLDKETGSFSIELNMLVEYWQFIVVFSGFYFILQIFE